MTGVVPGSAADRRGFVVEVTDGVPCTGVPSPTVEALRLVALISIAGGGGETATGFDRLRTTSGLRPRKEERDVVGLTAARVTGEPEVDCEEEAAAARGWVAGRTGTRALGGPMEREDLAN